MDDKQLLKNLAFDVNTLLDVYIVLHNKRLKKAGTFLSLFKKVDFGELYEESELLLKKFFEKSGEIEQLKSKQYRHFSKSEQAFFDCLNKYFNALHETSENLRDIAKYQHDISTGKIASSWKENQQLEGKYKNSIDKYYSLGKELNILYKDLENS